jgi:8-oxo-dGTP pyrophosphatase MutT (NUDIX family)
LGLVATFRFLARFELMSTIRTSFASLCLITKIDDTGPPKWLTQWNSKWHAYSLLGGHLECDETYFACCEREASEELKCETRRVVVVSAPIAIIHFREFSRSASELTDYIWHVFDVHVDDSVLSKLPENCEWLTLQQICAGVTDDGRPISGQVKRVFSTITRSHVERFHH